MGVSDAPALRRPVLNERVISGALITAAAAVLFGTKGILVKLTYPYGVDATTLLGLRMAMALPFFAIIAWRGGLTPAKPVAPLSWRDRCTVAGGGLIGYQLASWLDFVGLQTVDVATERMLLYLYPTVVVLLGAILGRQALTRVVLGALALTYAGIALTYHGQQHARGVDPQGALLIVGSAVAYAVFLVGAAEQTKRLGGVRTMAVAMCAAAVGVVLQCLLTRPLSVWLQPWPVYGFALALALPGTVLPGLLAGVGLQRIGAARAAVVGMVGPVATVLLAWAVLGEVPGDLAWLGIACTLAGGVLISLPARSPAVSAARSG
jgi:drug/metabolite transporter (DMT)-like permease